jgi:thiol:disulfide interchange protein
MVERMRRWRAAWAAFALLLFAAQAGAQIDAGTSGDSLFGPAAVGPESIVAVRAEFTPPAAGKPAQLFVTASIQPGWHIYSIAQPEGGPIATKIDLTRLPPGVRLAGPFKPSIAPDEKKEPAFDNLTVESHHGEVTWHAPLEWPAGIDPAGASIEGKILVQPCDANSCLPPTEIPFTAALGKGMALPSESAAAKTEVKAQTTATIDWPALLVQLGFAFLGGLILNVMPCVLPVISLKVLSFLQQAGESRGRVFALNVWYSLGLLAVFMVLAALAVGVGTATDERLGWGQQFTVPWFKVSVTALVFAMALSLLGVWEIPVPGFVGAGRAGELQSKEGPLGAFFKGMFTTILATPCSGPFLGPVFAYVLKQPPYVAYWVFGAVGLGMAFPYLVIGAFPALIRFLPKPGAWMVTVQQLTGFFLLAVVVYLFSTLTAAFFVSTLALLVGLWFACWWIGRTPLVASSGQKLAAWIGGPAVAAAVGFFAFTFLLQESKIPWQPFSPESLQRARSNGRTVMVDFSANWCPTCKWNLKVAIETDAVRDLIKTNRVVPMIADWTDRSPIIKKALNDLGYNSIPLLVIWPSTPPEAKPIILPDLMTQDRVLEAIKQAGPSRPPESTNTNAASGRPYGEL